MWAKANTSVGWIQLTGCCCLPSATTVMVLNPGAAEANQCWHISMQPTVLLPAHQILYNSTLGALGRGRRSRWVSSTNDIKSTFLQLPVGRGRYPKISRHI